jgi:hypothetical protein
MAKTIEQAKEEIKTDIDRLTVSLEESKKKGFQIEDIAKFAFDAGTSLVEAVENVKDLTGEQKKEVVISSVKEIYNKVNPDIPLIPEPFETLTEHILLDKALGKFIDVIVSKYNEKGVFKRKSTSIKSKSKPIKSKSKPIK